MKIIIIRNVNVIVAITYLFLLLWKSYKYIEPVVKAKEQLALLECLEMVKTWLVKTNFIEPCAR